MSEWESSVWIQSMMRTGINQTKCWIQTRLQICETFVLIWNIKSGWRRTGILTKHQSWESHKFENLHCKDFLFHSCDMNSYMTVFGPVKSELRQNYWRLYLMHSSATYLQSNPFEPLFKHHWCKSKSIPLKTTLRRTYTAALTCAASFHRTPVFCVVQGKRRGL